MRTAIVTDSTSDIPKHIIEKESISIIPAILVIGGKSLIDGFDITRNQFYEQIPEMKTPPTTATPSIGSFQKIYDRLIIDGYENIISIHVASKLSGIFSTAHLASKPYNGRVNVIDSGQLSMGLGFQVLAASKAASDGLNLNQIISKIENIRDRIRVFAMLDTLEYVRRSGRVSWAKARISSLLKIKPMLEVRDGKVYNRGQVRTRKKGFKHLISICKGYKAIERIAALHTNAESEANQLLEDLDLSLAEIPMVVNVTTIIGTHVGPNGLGIVLVLK